MEPMSLVGGITGYDKNGEEVRYEDGNMPFGRKVFYLEMNGTTLAREKADSLFNKLQILEVAELYVHDSYSEVVFTQYPNIKFNSVLFGDLILPNYKRPTKFTELHSRIKLDKTECHYKDSDFSLDIKNTISSVYGFDACLINKIYKASCSYSSNYLQSDVYIDKFLTTLCAEHMSNAFKRAK